MRISVVIPTHDRLALVAEAVRSVLAQTLKPIDVIVVDDGSTDGTAGSLAASFASQVHLLTTSNRGPAAARNLGVAHARGDWIAFLDSDDLWLPDKLAAQAALLGREPAVEICHTDEIWMRDGRRVNQRHRHRKPSGNVFEACLRLCLISPSTVLLRRSLFERVGGFDEGLAVCEDYDLWLRICRDNPVALVDEPLIIRRGGHGDQLSRRYWGMDRFRVAALARVLAEGRLRADDRAVAVAVLVEKCAVLAQGARRRGRDDEAARYEALAAYFTD